MNKQAPVLSELAFVLILFLAIVFFGAAHPWAMMLICYSLFFLIFIHPSHYLNFQKIPRFFVLNFLIILGVSLLQSLWIAQNTLGALQVWLYVLALSCLFVMTQNLDFKSLTSILFFLVMCALGSVFYSLTQVYSGSEYVLWQAKRDHLGYLTGTFMNRNHFAAFLQVTLGIVLGFGFVHLRHKNYRQIIISLSLFAILIFGLFKTGSRAGLCSFLGTLILFAILFLKKLRAQSFFLWVMIGLTFCCAYFLQGSEIFHRLRFIIVDPELQGVGRIQVWRDSLAMLKDHWFLGVGLGNFAWNFPLYQSADLVQHWSYAHQGYLQLILELGIPLAFLFFFSFSLFFLKIIRQLPLDQDPALLTLGILLGLTSFLLHGLVDFHFSLPALALVFTYLSAVSWKLVNP